MLLVENGKGLAVSANAFRRTEKKVSAGIQGVVKRSGDSVLKIIVKVDQKIAA
jgi:hypothetical protein